MLKEVSWAPAEVASVHRHDYTTHGEDVMKQETWNTICARVKRNGLAAAAEGCYMKPPTQLQSVPALKPFQQPFPSTTAFMKASAFVRWSVIIVVNMLVLAAPGAATAAHAAAATTLAFAATAFRHRSIRKEARICKKVAGSRRAQQRRATRRTCRRSVPECNHA